MNPFLQLLLGMVTLFAFALVGSVVAGLVIFGRAFCRSFAAAFEPAYKAAQADAIVRRELEAVLSRKAERVH